MMCNRIILGMLVFLLSGTPVLMASPSRNRTVYTPPRQELLAGIGLTRIAEKGRYNFVPFFLEMNFDKKAFFADKGYPSRGMFDLVWEIEGAYVFTPNDNAEIGNNFLLKYGFMPTTSRWQPYIKGGVGVIFITEHIPHQSTQLNFNEYAGLGTHYFLRPETLLTLEYRFRHLSNAYIERPNAGVNSNLILMGCALKF